MMEKIRILVRKRARVPFGLDCVLCVSEQPASCFISSFLQLSLASNEIVISIYSMSAIKREREEIQFPFSTSHSLRHELI